MVRIFRLCEVWRGSKNGETRIGHEKGGSKLSVIDEYQYINH
jgi:hypothetical protein